MKPIEINFDYNKQHGFAIFHINFGIFGSLSNGILSIGILSRGRFSKPGIF